MPTRAGGTTLSGNLIRNAIGGAFGRARFLQESPILPDVWLGYLELRNPEKVPPNQKQLPPINRRADLLLSCATGSEPGTVAKRLQDKLFSPNPAAARIAHNRTSVVAELTFSELIGIVVPMTRWWGDLPPHLRNFDRARQSLVDKQVTFASSAEVEFFTFAATAGLLGLLLKSTNDDEAERLAKAMIEARGVTPEIMPLLEEYQQLAQYFEYSSPPDGAAIGRVQLNRRASLSVRQSRQTIKADASYNLFRGSAAKLKWAVIDCGIDARHPGFAPPPPAPGAAPAVAPAGAAFVSRVVTTYDFTGVRDLLSGSATHDAAGRPIEPALVAALKTLNDAGRQVDWSLVKDAVTIPHVPGLYKAPTADHGTHVAGIIGANWERDPDGKPVIGICPDIGLVDVRVFDGAEADEFNVIAALQFISYLNRSSEVLEIPGVNISFSFAHDVRNYACGRTPICNECEKLIDNGVVVVTAAGNAGYRQAEVVPTLADRYATMSITDPGNAPSVITVGSTHRTQPHTYGVSFFSSRGPTGDGRAKPDILAPGEKILSTTLNDKSGEKDGTSMAAPHVSGAAAILMTRNAELIGKPRMIKDILCRSATDLGREKSFQGAGIVDVLRALQSL